MESFANYIRYSRSITLGPEALTTNLIGRNISSTCNSSGSAIWASAKNIKPLVDANCHTEAMEFAYHQSPIRFPPIHYRNPGSESLSPSGQTILFGCPLELRTVGELKKIPPILEYLLDSLDHWSVPEVYGPSSVGRKHRNRTSNSLNSKVGQYCWHFMYELEQVWTGVEETDRASILKHVPQDTNRMRLIMVCPLRHTIQYLSDLCRDTLQPFQSRCGQTMTLMWLGRLFANRQA